MIFVRLHIDGFGFLIRLRDVKQQHADSLNKYIYIYLISLSILIQERSQHFSQDNKEEVNYR